MATRRIALSITFICISWTLSYVVYGNTADGHTWFGNVSARLFEDSKGGVPLLTLAFPLLVSSSSCALLLLAPQVVQKQSYVPWSRALAFPQSASQRLRKKSGDIDFDILSLFFILVPCICYLLSHLVRHLYGHNLSTEDRIMETGNSFGQMAMVALSFFLVPVARHSSLLTLMGWSQEQAVRMHIWSGRICIVGVAFHGLAHCLRWWLMQESILHMLLPDRACWKKDNSDYEPKCTNGDTDCSCYCLFRNLTGFLAMVALLIIGGSSVGYVRRNNYSLFYALHATAGPCALLMAILHWNRMVLFLCPGVLYYAASSAPILVQSLRSYIKDSGLKVLSASDLASICSDAAGETRPCISLTFQVSDEAANQYRPGQYVKLKVPSLSTISHPFTVNRVPGRPHQMRIIFRATGPFTRALAEQLLRPKSSQASSDARPLAPIVLMDGFYGQQRRVQQVLSFDVVAVIAGGIGITPYLSMMTDLRSILQTENDEFSRSVGGVNLKEITLHWICRDSNLIEYVSKEYFAPLLGDGGLARDGADRQSSCRIRIIIHDTNSDASSSSTTHSRGDHDSISLCSMGVPFSPSRFSCGTKDSILLNLPYFFTYSLIAWSGLLVIWLIYDTVQSKSEIMSRAYGLLAALAMSLIISYGANVILDIVDTQNALSRWGRFRRHAYTSLWRIRKEHASDDDFLTDEMTQGGESDMERGLSLPNITSAGGDESARKNLRGPDSMSADVCTPTSILEEGRGDSGSLEHGDEEATFISMDKCAGRPSPHALMNCLDEARNPAIFCCGPKSMTRDIKIAARARCSMRLQQCLEAATPAVYEETFEM